MSILKNRYEILALVQAKMCNPNGDPDMGNRPRIDFETNRGIITDVAFKARIRAYMEDAYAGVNGCNILLTNGANINKAIAGAVLDANGVTDLKGDNTKVKEAAEIMCQRYWDVRTFGGVLSTGLNAGQVRGAVQVGMSTSIDPIEVEEISITRKAFTADKFSNIVDYEKAEAKMSDAIKRTMGNKQYTPYGLYVMKMTVSANLAQKVGFTDEDLQMLLESVVQMYDNGVSSSKMGMSVLMPVVVFKHVGTHGAGDPMSEKEALFGCTSAYKLFDLLDVHKKDGIEFPRDYKDYDINLKLSELPAGVECYAKDAALSSLRPLNAGTDIVLV